MPSPRSSTAFDVEFGALLRERRLAIGMSQERLAGILGISFQQLQKYERGTNRMSLSRAVAACAALDVAIADLIPADQRKAA